MKVALCACAASAAQAPPSVSYGAARIRLKGSAHLEAHASREHGRLALAGAVLDDARRPIAGAQIAISLRAASESGATSLVPEACIGDAAGPAPQLDRPDRVVVTTDAQARFCARFLLPVGRYVAHVEVRDTPLVDGAALDVPLDLARAAVTLRFEPERSVLRLDEEATTIEAIASMDSDGVAAALPGLAIVLANESGPPLASATTDGTGHARFVLDGARLGAPGRGLLRVSFAGNAALSPAARAIEVERRTRVEIAAPEAVDGRLPPGSPEDGAALRVIAVSRCAHKGCAGWPAGSVQVTLGAGGDLVGASPLDAGEARLVLAFTAPAAAEVPIRVRYVPSAPWFEPSNDLPLVLPVRGPSPWKKASLVLAAVVALAWVALLRLPLRPGRGRRARPPPRPHVRGADLALVRAAPASQGWTGQVIDAHDGTPVVGARVALERPTFERADVVIQTTSDNTGRFALEAVEARPGDEFVASGALHDALRRPVPARGELTVTLVLRRRAIVDRLVHWARRRGGRFDALPDATPGHVRRAAAGSDATVARWADAVERAAYGEGVVDEGAQAQVDDLAPKGDGRP
jgi:hypothetical protein